MGLIVRALVPDDREQWEPLWAGYNLFYERPAFPREITDRSWSRFLDPREPVFAAVAAHNGVLIGLAHWLFHPSTTAIEPVCYLQDLFTAADARGQGVATALIEHVSSDARKAGARRLYWQTARDNPARKLYDRMARLTPFRRYVMDLA